MDLTGLWTSFKQAIVPKSHAEATVDTIYSPENRGLLGTPGYAPEPTFYPAVASLPAFTVAPYNVAHTAYVDLKTGVKQFAQTAGAVISGGASNLMIYLLIGVAIFAVFYGLAKK